MRYPEVTAFVLTFEVSIRLRIKKIILLQDNEAQNLPCQPAFKASRTAV